MYHLTCPSCQDKTDSPFVRSGAVVHCAACENKYRIKSAHFEREVHTGPRTLDETDSVLRSDSVDIDPDEVSPVSIDDDGNVVGLSGLSELMRWSDDQTNVQSNVDAKRSKSKAKAASKADAPLPQAKPAKKKPAKAKPPKTKLKPDAATSGRQRAQELRQKKRNKQFILLGSIGGAVILLGIIIVLLLPDNTQTVQTDPEPDKPGTDSNPAPPDPDTQPVTDTPKPDIPSDGPIFSQTPKPSPNPTPTFVAPWIKPDTGLPPIDVPTVLTPAKQLTHENWYVMNPPRGAADAAGVSNVELGQINASPLNQTHTLLVGQVANNDNRVVMQGELHIMLLDSTGSVFAETYTPLAMLKAKSKQHVALTIPTRYWKRSRGVRAGVQVSHWADTLTPMQGVKLDPVGQAQAAALRVSVKHQGDKPLRSVKIMLTATDAANKTIATFLLEEKNLYVNQNQWLDLVIATPLPHGKQANNWSATLIAQ